MKIGIAVTLIVTVACSTLLTKAATALSHAWWQGVLLSLAAIALSSLVGLIVLLGTYAVVDWWDIKQWDKRRTKQ